MTCPLRSPAWAAGSPANPAGNRALAWARRLVLRLGPEVAVLAPPELAEAVRAQAAAALDGYATPTGLADPTGSGG